ncbi:MAG: hypothetical protein R3Y33_02440 [Clostridia bacterium]
MKLITYQSEVVLKILNQNIIYRAKPSISFKKEYACLIDMLKLDCACPVFAVVDGKKQNSSGRISSSVKLMLDVPDDQIKYTEFSVWADFMYASKFSKPYNYRKLMASSHDISFKHYQDLINKIETQLPCGNYQYPQAILEYIDPKWLVSSTNFKKTPPISFIEKLGNLFRK